MSTYPGGWESCGRTTKLNTSTLIGFDAPLLNVPQEAPVLYIALSTGVLCLRSGLGLLAMQTVRCVDRQEGWGYHANESPSGSRTRYNGPHVLRLLSYLEMQGFPHFTSRLEDVMRVFVRV